MVLCHDEPEVREYFSRLKNRLTLGQTANVLFLNVYLEMLLYRLPLHISPQRLISGIENWFNCASILFGP